MLLLLLLGLALVVGAGTRRTEDVLVTTQLGTIRGRRVRADYRLHRDAVTHTVDQFLGLPFAAPPVGERRFMPPAPPEPWGERVYEAVTSPPVCPQVTIFHPECAAQYQDEDCLYLSVFAPHLRGGGSGSGLPVMVYIHGGSYEVGSGKLYDGSVLAMHGVVVVTVNYRLGALGYLTSGDAHLPGNYGLLDQLAALRWVRAHVAAFGGDPGRVTVFGHSAGGASAGMLLVVPQAAGLFHGVIAQSGSAVAAYSCHSDDTVDFNWYITKVGELFGCSNTSFVAAIVACLRRTPWQSFIDKRVEFPLFDPIDPEFRPYVDGAVVPDLPRRLLQRGIFHRVPVLTGTVTDEFSNYFSGGLRYKPVFDLALDRYVEKFVGAPLAGLVRFEYTDFERRDHGGRRGFLDRGAILSDMHMVAPTVDLATLVSQHHPEVYQYLFSTSYSYHSVELNYVYGAPFSGKYADEMTSSPPAAAAAATGLKNFSRAEKRQSALVMTLWTNFAKYGHAVFDPAESPLGFAWEPFTPYNRTYLHLHLKHNRLEQHLRADRVSFWNSLIPTLHNVLAGPNSSTVHHGDGIDTGDVALGTNTGGDTVVSTADRSSPPHVVRTGDAAPSLWIFIALSVALAVAVLVMLLFILRLTLQLRRVTASRGGGATVTNGINGRIL